MRLRTDDIDKHPYPRQMPTQRTLLSWAIAVAAAIAAMAVFLWDGSETGETADEASMARPDNVAVAIDVLKWNGTRSSRAGFPHS